MRRVGAVEYPQTRTPRLATASIVAGITAKLDRAGVHLRELRDEVANTRLPPYSIGGGDRGLELRARCSQDHRHLGWGVVVGEVVHGLRSSLDHLAWGLTVAYSGPPPATDEARRGKWRRVQFPIRRSAREFEKSARSSLWGVHPSHLGIFKRAQPYRWRSPEHHPLALLEAIWTIDKHRNTPVVRPDLTALGIEFEPPFVGTFLRVPAMEPMDEGSLLGLIEIQMAGPATDDPQVGDRLRLSATFGFSLHPRFLDGPPLYGKPVVETLETIYQYVRALVHSAEQTRLL